MTNAILTNSESFKSKVKLIGKTPASGNTNDSKMAVPIKYLSNFRKAFEIPLINFEINLVLTWPSVCVITISTAAGAFAVTDTKLYVPVLTL